MGAIRPAGYSAGGRVFAVRPLELDPDDDEPDEPDELDPLDDPPLLLEPLEPSLRVEPVDPLDELPRRVYP